MFAGEFIGCPFDRKVVGSQGGFLVRTNVQLVKEATTAIARRRQPGWSRMLDDYRVERTAA